MALLVSNSEVKKVQDITTYMLCVCGSLRSWLRFAQSRLLPHKDPDIPKRVEARSAKWLVNVYPSGTSLVSRHPKPLPLPDPAPVAIHIVICILPTSCPNQQQHTRYKTEAACGGQRTPRWRISNRWERMAAEAPGNASAGFLRLQLVISAAVVECSGLMRELRYAIERDGS